MPTNIEIKAKISDLEVFKGKVKKLAIKETGEIFQEDTFFRTEKGRLKLRVLSENKGELIYYERNNSAEPKRSDYYIYKTNEPGILKQVLRNALGMRGVVNKKRLLYIIGNTRIHLDEVEHLGSFIELEIVLSTEQNDDEGKSIANDLMVKLDINKNDLIDKAYIDLIEKSI
jgi:predicted adenylyl cyclase CyaB